MLSNLLKFQSPTPSDIPKINLYMDQLTSWLDEVLHPFLLAKEEKTLTKTMINNYVKARLLSAPDKKKYTQEQLKMLVMVYHLKNVLSMEDLKLLFQLDKYGNPALPVEEWYSFFLEAEATQLKEMADLEAIDLTSEDMVRKTALLLAEEANLKKRASELLLSSLKKPSEK